MTPEEIQELKDACRQIARDAELIAELFHARLFELDRALLARPDVRPRGQRAVEGRGAERGGAGWTSESRGASDGCRPEPVHGLTPRESALLKALEHALGARLSPVALTTWLRICWTMSRAMPGARQERAA